MNDPTDLRELNHTELVALCRAKGYAGASRSVPRQDLIEVLEGKLAAENIGDPINRHRKAIEAFLDAEPSVISQLRCNADHISCPPAQVLECFGSSDRIKEFYE